MLKIQRPIYVLLACLDVDALRLLCDGLLLRDDDGDAVEPGGLCYNASRLNARVNLGNV